MFIDGFEPVQRLARYLRRRWASGALILLYHRINEPASDPWSLAVSPRNFAAHLAILRRCAQPVSLDNLCQYVEKGKRVPRRVVLTFDDGYLDNLTQAMPLLEHFEVPATVYITSGYTGEMREFWWDELELLLLHPGRLPETLTLTIKGQAHIWNLIGDANVSASDFLRHRSWMAGGENFPTARHRAYVEIHRLIGVLADDDRRHLMDQLAEVAGLRHPIARDGFRPLAPSEIKTLDQSEWIEIGAHTKTHPMLDLLPIELQREEIQSCKNDLELLLQRRVTRFAYPYGRYSSNTPDLVRSLGFDNACTVNSGHVCANSDPFQLNRVVVCNWTGEEFADRLSKWMQIG